MRLRTDPSSGSTLKGLAARGRTTSSWCGRLPDHGTAHFDRRLSVYKVTLHAGMSWRTVAGATPFVYPVVPLHQVIVDLERSVTGQRRSLEGHSISGDEKTLSKLYPASIPFKAIACCRPISVERLVGASGVLTGDRPLGLAVADEHNARMPSVGQVLARMPVPTSAQKLGSSTTVPRNQSRRSRLCSDSRLSGSTILQASSTASSRAKRR